MRTKSPKCILTRSHVPRLWKTAIATVRNTTKKKKKPQPISNDQQNKLLLLFPSSSPIFDTIYAFQQPVPTIIFPSSRITYNNIVNWTRNSHFIMRFNWKPIKRIKLRYHGRRPNDDNTRTFRRRFLKISIRSELI